MKTQFFDQFLFQREMYFSSCLVHNWGNFYYSKINDPIWNFFVPNSNEFYNHLNEIEQVFKDENKHCCIITPKDDLNNNTKLPEKYQSIYQETWYTFKGKHKFDTKLKCSTKSNIDNVKSILFATYSTKNKGYQPWGNLDKNYFDIINDKLKNENIINFSLKKSNNIIAVCSLYKEFNSYQIFNFAIAPQFQNDKDVIEIFKHIINYYLSQAGNSLSIQLPVGHILGKELENLNFVEIFKVDYNYRNNK